MMFPGRLAWIAACLATGLALASFAPAADSLDKLRQEKARLTEMKKGAERAAAELAETLRREKMTRSRVDDLQTRLAKQRRLIARIDRRLSELGGQMGQAEREVRSLEEERGKSQRGLSAATAEVFAFERGRPGALLEPSDGERQRYFARRILVEELSRYGRLTADQAEKERILSGIERRLEDSERRMATQRKGGEKLASRGRSWPPSRRPSARGWRRSRRRKRRRPGSFGPFARASQGWKRWFRGSSGRCGRGNRGSRVPGSFPAFPEGWSFRWRGRW